MAHWQLPVESRVNHLSDRRERSAFDSVAIRRHAPVARARGRLRYANQHLRASLLIRAHLRTLTPLPTAELAALRCSVAEVGAISRNLNQIARAVNRGDTPTGPNRVDLQALLRELTGLRDISKP